MSHNQTLRIATRNSPLALWQTQHIRTQLLKHWPNLNIVLIPMTTSGDRFLNHSLAKIGGKGLFVKELEESLINHTADCAVHSIKDLPTSLPNNLILHTICKRDNPYDALISPLYSSVTTLPKNAKIGTSSLRRQAQLLALRPDLHLVPIRGNIQTRIDTIEKDQLDGIILAYAGLARMQLEHMVKEILDPKIMLPACGQGAIGIECRADDDRTHKLLAPLQDLQATICVNSERLVNAQLGGSCHTPIAIYSYIDHKNQLILQAKVANHNGSVVIQETLSGALSDANALSMRCAQRLLDRGAQQLLIN